MKRFLRFFFFFIIFSSHNAQWISLPSPCKATLRSVSFINSEIGWVCGDSGIILKTTNGGLYWDFKQIDPFFDFYSICFTDSLNGWAVGEAIKPIAGIGLIYNTTDGGNKWTKQFTTDYGLYKIHFTDCNNGWANDYGTLFRTTNGGVNWLIIDSLKLISFIYDVFNPDSNLVWILGDRDGPIGSLKEWGILKTNEGKYFREGKFYPAYYEDWPMLGSLFFLDSLIGWTGLLFNYRDWPSGGRIFKTTDGGNTWFKQKSFKEMISDIQFTDSLTGWITTTMCWCDDTTYNIYKTNDGGNSWRGQGLLSVYPDYNFLYEIEIINKNIGYAVGERGVILKTNNGGTPVVEKNISPKNFYLSQNYPNPFNPITTIRYQIPSADFVTLKVFDVLGKVVATLVNEYKPAGSYEIEFNTSRGEVTSPLPSGIYFYQLKAGDFAETKKLVLMK